MPDGSSSAAPVISPGPSSSKSFWRPEAFGELSTDSEVVPCEAVIVLVYLPSLANPTHSSLQNSSVAMSRFLSASQPRPELLLKAPPAIRRGNLEKSGLSLGGLSHFPSLRFMSGGCFSAGTVGELSNWSGIKRRSFFGARLWSVRVHG